jgi:hypothetical protein
MAQQATLPNVTPEIPAKTPLAKSGRQPPIDILTGATTAPRQRNPSTEAKSNNPKRNSLKQAAKNV